MQELRVEVEGRTVTLRDETVVQIGRDVPDGIVVQGHSVSRVHAELRRTGPTWTLVDLGSRNGTFINGQRITEQRISAPVTVHLGPPDSGTSLVLDTVSVPPADDAPADMSPAYAETMVAPAIEDLDSDDEAEPTGPNLIVQVGTAQAVFPHSATVSIGRMPDNDVVVADPACSRTHGYVEPTADGWMYRNVSSHGTFHRGERIDTVTLNVPTVLKLGDPDAGPRLELSHRGMLADLVPEPSDTGSVFKVGRHRISRRLVYGVLVVALYLLAAAWAGGLFGR
ncbi:MAG TPA: FHA domain-containing protein [Aeromicrobium sp.]|nr:FHA domain-containing protein [Aeromicrobium sp.]